MPDRLTRADVERIAALAHLDLTPDEIDLFTPQLADILEYAERLQAVDTSGADDVWHPGGARLSRDDRTPCGRRSTAKERCRTHPTESPPPRRSRAGSSACRE